MTSFRIFFSFISFMVLFSSCQKESTMENPIDKPTQQQLEFLATTFGYDKETIGFDENYFYCDKDVIFPRKDFWKEYGETPALPDSLKNLAKPRWHYANGPYLVSCGVIPVHVDRNIPYVWRVAISQAINEWNNLRGCVQFKYYRTNRYTYNGINVSYASLYYKDAIAWAARPRSNNYAGNEILLNYELNYKTKRGLNASKRKQTMVHELGHTIGFDHTDNPYYWNSWWISGASRYCNYADPGSVMRGSGAVNWNGFSSCDKKVFHYLY